MSFSLSQLLYISITYLIVLFGVAWITERGWIPSAIVRHPLVYTLSLGVYASSWTFYGMVGLAHQYGNGFLPIYLALSACFVIAPVLLLPIQRLTQTHQLSSLADLLAFRFHSSTAGALTTLGLLLTSLPLLALQMQAVAETVGILSGTSIHNEIALVFGLLIALFSILFGTQHSGSRQKHEGLVFAIAFESLLKLIALLCIAGVVVWSVFSGPTDIQHWLTNNRDKLEPLRATIHEGHWRVLLLLFFGSAIVMPHMYHMVFTENLNPKSMRSASWSMPLLLLLLCLPIPIILWGGMKLGLTDNPEYFTLSIGMALHNEQLTLLAYMGGLSAASGVIIVLTIALSGMVLNHLVLPVYTPGTGQNLYHWLRWSRRFLIFTMVMAGYGLYLVFRSDQDLSSQGLTAFSGGLQFLPGVLATLYWPRANSKGFIMGTLTGLVIWAAGLLLPLFPTLTWPGAEGSLLETSNWYGNSILALLANCFMLVLVSLLSDTEPEEQRSAMACFIQQKTSTDPRRLQAASAQEFITALSQSLGKEPARREVEQALLDLGLSMDEQRPFALMQLRERIKANLSGLMGPSIAQDITSSLLPYRNDSSNYQSPGMHIIESRIEDYQTRLTGLAAELDALRRYHRQTLQDLPLGICSLSSDTEILMWNRAMENLTGIPASRAVGLQLYEIAQPWQGLLIDFTNSPESHVYKQKFKQSNEECRWFNLHKATIDAPSKEEGGGIVLLIEDSTKTRLLENKLMHAERLASIGRLAAGVAHEIGNPLTGIACLAQTLRDEREDDQEVVEINQQIIEQTRRITRIVQSMMNFARFNSPSREEFKPVNLHQVCNEAIDLLQLNPHGKPVQYLNLCAPQLTVYGDHQRLAQVFLNLLDNARDASPEHGKIRITSQLKDGYIHFCVEDQGCGIKQQQIDQLFEPFYTTKDPGKGTGLGLAMVFTIIEEHQGDISIISPCDKVTQRGTAFSIRLPLHLPLERT